MSDLHLEAQLSALTEPEIQLAGFSLVDLEVLGGGGRLTLRFSLTRAGGDGVSVDDCASASRAIARLLDAEAEELLRGRYVIEVSSPGIFRALRQPRDFQRNVGAMVKLLVEQDGSARQWRGEIVAADAEAVEIRTESGTERCAYSELRKAHLDPPLDFRRDKRSGDSPALEDERT